MLYLLASMSAIDREFDFFSAHEFFYTFQNAMCTNCRPTLTNFEHLVEFVNFYEFQNSKSHILVVPSTDSIALWDTQRRRWLKMF